MGHNPSQNITSNIQNDVTVDDTSKDSKNLVSLHPVIPKSNPSNRNIIGRFAPSPTGKLHLGSLVTAMASFCHIRSLNGQWRLRIEDTDYQRCHSKFSNSILHDLSNLGLHWDGDILYQSQRTDIYNDYLNGILKSHSYACECSRKSLKNFPVYPQNCLQKTLNRQQNKLRIRLPDQCIRFIDGIQGTQIQNPQLTLGDMVVRRAHSSTTPQIINYILAVTIDDGLQGISHVMRGLDILPMTSAQIAITKMANLPDISHWYHLPLVLNNQGQKLSKQNLATPIDTSTEYRCSQLLKVALAFLNQPTVVMDTPERMLKQAIIQWDTNLISQVSGQKQYMD